MCVAMNTNTSDFCALSPVRITEIAVRITEDVLYDVQYANVKPRKINIKCTCTCIEGIIYSTGNQFLSQKNVQKVVATIIVQSALFKN